MKPDIPEYYTLQKEKTDKLKAMNSEYDKKADHVDILKEMHSKGKEDVGTLAAVKGKRRENIGTLAVEKVIMTGIENTHNVFRKITSNNDIWKRNEQERGNDEMSIGKLITEPKYSIKEVNDNKKDDLVNPKVVKELIESVAKGEKDKAWNSFKDFIKEIGEKIDFRDKIVEIECTPEKDSNGNDYYNYKVVEEPLNSIIAEIDGKSLKEMLKEIAISWADHPDLPILPTIETVCTLVKSPIQYTFENYNGYTENPANFRKKIETFSPDFMERIGNKVPFSEEQIASMPIKLYGTALAGTFASLILGTAGGFVVTLPVGYLFNKIYK